MVPLSPQRSRVALDLLSAEAVPFIIVHLHRQLSTNMRYRWSFLICLELMSKNICEFILSIPEVRE